MNLELIAMISSIAASISALMALITVVINFIFNLNGREEKFLSVQPWFYLQSFSTNGQKEEASWKIYNVGNKNIKIKKIYLSFYNSKTDIEANYKIINKYEENLQFISLKIPYEKLRSSYEQPFQIIIEYSNLYNRDMRATSDVIRFKKINMKNLYYY